MGEVSNGFAHFAFNFAAANLLPTEGHNLRGIIGPDLRGFGGWGEIGAVFCVRQNGPDCIVATRFNGINFSLTN